MGRPDSETTQASEAQDVAEQTLDGTLPYEETWHTNATNVVALVSRVAGLEAQLRERDEAPLCPVCDAHAEVNERHAAEAEADRRERERRA